MVAARRLYRSSAEVLQHAHTVLFSPIGRMADLVWLQLSIAPLVLQYDLLSCGVSCHASMTEGTVTKGDARPNCQLKAVPPTMRATLST